MPGIKLKICGLRDNVEEVAALQPDYVGFIFYPRSPRYVGADFNMPQLDGRIKKVGVFVNEPVELVLKIVRKYLLDFVQLHGSEMPEDCRIIKENGIGVIKALSIDENFDFNKLEPYKSIVDYFLFDTRTRTFGGSGVAFNWKILKKYELDKGYFLSGGISLDNLDRLTGIDLDKVYALDVNSKFEVKAGLKDIHLLKELKIRIRELNKKLVTGT